MKVFPGRNIFKLLFSLGIFSLCILFFQACSSANKYASEDGELLKNWDTVNRKLEFYSGKAVAEVLNDFGKKYEVEKDEYTFYSPLKILDKRTCIVFIVKRNKVKDFYYKGSYTDIYDWLESISRLKDCEIKNMAEAWLGYSPDLLRETFSSLICKCSDKSICAGPSESVCIEFVPASYSMSASKDKNSKAYIKKVNVKGSWEKLKDYVVSVPEGSKPVKTIKQKN